MNSSVEERNKKLAEALWKRIESGVIRIVIGPVELLSLLKHRIVHLWLPLDIDCQGIQEVRSQQSELSAQGYLKNILGSKNDNVQYYRQKLAEQQYAVAGERVDFSEAGSSIRCQTSEVETCNAIASPSKKILLTYGKSVHDLILESDKKNVIDSKNWQALWLLSGLELINGVDGKNPTGKIYKPIDYGNSPVFRFMCLMDCMIKNWPLMGDSDKFNAVSHVLAFAPLKAQLTSLGFQTSDLVFHDWFCALDETLNTLREEVKPEKT